MRLLHLYRPHLILDLAKQRLPSGSWPAGPIVLGGKPWSDGTVLDTDPAARALGVRRGMPLGSAHRLAPEATFLDPEPEADQQRIAEHLGPAFRITPIGARRFRCNRYTRPDGLHATGWQVETFVLRVTGTGIERLSDHEVRSNRVRYG